MMAAPKTAERQCVSCGKGIAEMNSRARYCSADCRTTARRERRQRARETKRGHVFKTDQARARAFGASTEAEVIEAIAQGLGIKTSIAKRLGVGRSTIDKWIEASPTIAAAFDNALELLLDTAEHKLIEQVLGGDLKAIRYLLDTKGKARGYGQPNRLLVGVSQLTPEERSSRFARVARAFGHDISSDGVAGVIDVSATDDDE